MMAAVLERITPAVPSRPDAGTVHWFDECVARGLTGVFSETTTLTPGLAGELLKRNPDNRNVRKAKLEQFIRDMQRGSWTFNGEPIIVSKDGLINDGQHRLRAVVEANVTIPILFVFGVEREARLTVDQGSARGAGDFLAMEGIENANLAASIGRLIIAIERENCTRLYRESDVTNIEVRQRVMSDPKVAIAAEYAMSVYRYTKAFCAPTVIGTAFYLLSEVNPADAKEFMDQVSIGEELRRDTPPYAVRDALLALSRGMRGKGIEVIFRGWVKHRAGEPLKIAKALGHFPELD